MSLRLVLVLLSVISVAISANAESSTRNLGDAVGKRGEIWETYYKFAAFIDGGKPTSLVYQNLEQFDLHHEFLATLPAFQGMNRDQIDRLTYRASDGRLAYTGVLVVHAGDEGIHRSRISLAMEDAPSAELVAQIFDLVRKSSPSEDRFGTALDFELLPHQEKAFAGQIAPLKEKGIELYYDQNRLVDSISYTEAWNTGTLTIVTNQEELDAKVQSGEVNQNTIIFAKEALREIPAVAGVISGVPLTPASHTVLLAQMYGIPVAYFRDAEKIFTPFAGRILFLNARGSPIVSMDRRQAQYAVDPAPSDLAVLKALKVKRRIEIPFQPEELAIRPAQELTQKDIGIYGGKASQMGALMRRLPQNSVEQALGIPLGFSLKFLRTARASTNQTLSDYIAAQLATLDDESAQDLKKVEAVTARIQSEIKGAAFPSEDLKLIEETVRAYFPGNPVKVRFRSSSNVEDGGEFNGAGLYDSTGVWLVGRKRDDVGEKLKKVIASLYNARAYMARRKFSVDESRVGMGILVHPSFNDEVGNGVIRLIVDGERRRFNFEAVTLRGDDEQVTHATGAGAAEVLTGYGDYGTREPWENLRIEQPYEGYSRERSLFPAPVYLKLAKMMAEIAAEYDTAEKEIDIESEFKVMTKEGGGYEVFVKQVRRVPRPGLQKTEDGSAYVVLANRVNFLRTNANLGNAFADLWSPLNIEVEMDTFSEIQIRQNRVTAKKASFELRGRKYSIANPKVTSAVNDQYGGYTVTIELPTEEFPSFRIDLSNSARDPGVHALGSGAVYAMANFSAEDLKILKPAKLAENESIVYDSSVPQLLPSKKGRLDFVIKKRGSAVKVQGENTLFYGDGDGRSIRIGNAKISGVWTRELSIPKEAIGYGANHHQGDESYVIDLFADPRLTARERSQLNQAAGRYLYLVAAGYSEEDDEGAGGAANRAVLIKENGAVKKLGQWTATESNLESCASELTVE